MADSSRGRLTEAHRRAQLTIGAVTIAQLRVVWPLLDPENLEGSFGNWLLAVLAIIQQQRRSSATLAATYLTTLRALELGIESQFTPVLAVEANTQAVSTWMLVTGPVSIRANLARKIPLTQTLAIAEGRTAGAGMRHVLNGGRDTIVNTVEADPKALGFARAASGDACAFCAMLASRGPVYKSEQSALLRKDGHRYHDGCNCSVEPRYTRDGDWPAGSREYKQRWAETTRGFHGDDALNAFRRALGR